MKFITDNQGAFTLLILLLVAYLAYNKWEEKKNASAGSAAM